MAAVHDTEFRRARSVLNRRRFWCRLRLAIATTVGCLALGTGEAYLRLQSVRVESPDQALAEEVAQGLRVPPGANLLTTNLSRLSDQAECCPRAKHADIERKPPHGLVLRVEPRQPLLAIEREGRYLLADEEGVCLYWVQEPPERTLCVEGIPKVTVSVGDRASGEWFERSRTVALAVVDFPDLGPWRLDLQPEQPRELAVIAGSGARGIIGIDEGVGRRARLFAELLTELRKRGNQVEVMELRTRRPIWWGKPSAH